MKKAYGFATVPYIDSYYKKEDITFDEFKETLNNKGIARGEESIGVSLVDYDEINKVDDEFVFAIGIWDGKKYALIGKDIIDTKVVEYDYSDKWDVT